MISSQIQVIGRGFKQLSIVFLKRSLRGYWCVAITQILITKVSIMIEEHSIAILKLRRL